MLATVFACLLACGETRAVSELLPADTACVLVADDVPALCAALASLPFCAGLRADACAPVRAAARTAWRDFVAEHFDRVDPDALAGAAISRAFVATVFDDEGDLALLFGIEGANDLLASIGTVDDDTNVVHTWDDWSFIADEDAVAHRPLDVLLGSSPALGSRARFITLTAELGPAGPRAAWCWIDRDALFAGVIPFADRVDLETKEFGAMAVRLDVVDGVLHSTLVNEFGAEPSLIRVDAPRAFDEATFELVPAHARGFGAWNFPLATWLRDLAAQLASDEETEDDAERVIALADALGQRVLVVANAAPDGVDTQWEAWIEVDPHTFRSETFDAAMDVVDRLLADACTSGRFQRDDGTLIRELSFRDEEMLPKTLWYSCAGGWLVASTHPERLDAMLVEARANGAHGRPDIREHPAFAAAYATLRSDAPAVHGVSFVDPAATFANTVDTGLAITTYARAHFDLDPTFDVSALRELHRLLAAETPSVAISWHTPVGIVTRHRGLPLGDFAFGWCLLPGAMLRAKAALSAIDLKQTNDTRREAIRMDLEFIKEAVDRYERDHGRLPDALDVLLSADPANFGQPYLDHERRLTDSWGNRYRFDTLVNGEYRISCFGADGKRGGVGPNADVHVMGP